MHFLIKIIIFLDQNSINLQGKRNEENKVRQKKDGLRRIEICLLRLTASFEKGRRRRRRRRRKRRRRRLRRRRRKRGKR